MLDDKLKAWLIEVNHTPSFRSDTDVDYQVKKDLLEETFKIISLSSKQRKKLFHEMQQE